MSSGPKFTSYVASFTTLSFNVYSLKEVEEDCHDSPDGLDYKSRALLVDRIRDKGYTACCFQETRTAQREFSVPGFSCVASGHFNKKHGVEMWLSNLENIPVNDPISGQLTYASFDLDHMVIIHREPRILILSVRLCGEAATFLFEFMHPIRCMGRKRYLNSGSMFLLCSGISRLT